MRFSLGQKIPNLYCLTISNMADFKVPRTNTPPWKNEYFTVFLSVSMSWLLHTAGASPSSSTRASFPEARGKAAWERCQPFLESGHSIHRDYNVELQDCPSHFTSWERCPKIMYLSALHVLNTKIFLWFLAAGPTANIQIKINFKGALCSRITWY